MFLYLPKHCFAITSIQNSNLATNYLQTRVPVVQHEQQAPIKFSTLVIPMLDSCQKNSILLEVMSENAQTHTENRWENMMGEFPPNLNVKCGVYLRGGGLEYLTGAESDL